MTAGDIISIAESAYYNGKMVTLSDIRIYPELTCGFILSTGAGMKNAIYKSDFFRYKKPS